jgi:hypothetical protein
MSYYKDVIDWSKVKEGEPVEYDCRLYYFAGIDNTEKLPKIFIKLKSYKHEDIENTSYDSSYCRPLDKSYIKREVDWSKVPVDAKVIVNFDKKNRHFARFDGIVYCYDGGTTSWTSKGFTIGCNPDQVELVEDENVTKES